MAHDASTDESFMLRALELAARGPAVNPNPRVGAVVTDTNGAVVGEGWHAGAGTPHAEAAALIVAGERARGGTAYVTLEPCNHTGRTGPCARALIEAGVARVVYAVADPGAGAAGGARTLADAGVAVEEGVCREPATELNRHWLAAARLGRPVVTWKCASTLDGRIAAVDGTSRWITGEEARADVHLLRSRVGAVVIGTGTAIADDPRLTVRRNAVHPDLDEARQPLRVVVGDRPLPKSARLLTDGHETLVLPRSAPADVLATLWQRGTRRVLLESGGALTAAFWRAGLVDEVVAYVAPVLLGAGTPVIGELGLGTIDEAIRLRPHDIRRIGDDTRITAWTKEI